MAAKSVLAVTWISVGGGVICLRVRCTHCEIRVLLVTSAH
jgi:hypothetical protein